MEDRMTVARSFEEGMFILRENDCLWRINEEGEIESLGKGLTSAIKQLAFIQQWKTPPRESIQK